MSDRQEPLDFKTVMLPYLDEAYNLARWLMGNAADAENVTLEAVTQALKYFDTFKGTSARAWLLQIVRDVAHRALRKRREGTNVVRLDPPSGAETEPVRTPNLKLVGDALTQLPHDLLECIILYEVNGCSYKEIAAITGTPIGIVMSRLWRARGKLAEWVATFGEDGARIKDGALERFPLRLNRKTL